MANKEERIARRVEQRLVRSTMQAFSGPLPPFAMLAEYNNVVQNGAERIMQMAEKQQEHGLERHLVRANATDQRLGMILGFIVMVAVAGAGVWCVSQGKDLTGAAALVAAVGGPVCAFVYGRKRQEAERNEKR